MDIQALIQEKIKSKELSKAVKAGNKKTSIPLNKITDPSALGSGAIASQREVNQSCRQLERTLQDMSKATETLNPDELAVALSKLISFL